MTARIRVLVVDDSPFMLSSMKHVLANAPDVEITATASRGEEAIAYVRSHPVDVLLLDMNMPGMNGAETLQHIMEIRPVPTIVFSASDRSDPQVIKALELGALDMIRKPGSNERSVLLLDLRDSILEKIRLAARSNLTIFAKQPRRTAPPPSRRSVMKADLVVIGVSTGGPSTLARIFSSLPPAYPVPILVVQHICDGYTESLAKSLQVNCPLPIREASAYLPIEPGTITIAKSGYHLEVGKTQKIRLTRTPPRNGFIPSADVLFESAARNFEGVVLGIILTGMGGDGCEGCRELKARGHSVIIQDEATSVVWGMPGEVHRAGLFDQMLPLPEIGTLLKSLVPTR